MSDRIDELERRVKALEDMFDVSGQRTFSIDTAPPTVSDFLAGYYDTIPTTAVTDLDADDSPIVVITSPTLK